MEIRLRKKGDKYYQTVKSGKGLIREETEIELSSNQFELLWPLTESKRLEKRRYEINYKKHLLELDVYKGDLKNLATVEVEFMTETASNEFIAPAWFGSEITGYDRYKNKNLALFGTPD